MSLANDHIWWIQRGTQRAAVARVLRKPMTGSEICRAARAFSPKIQLRDVWFLTRQLWRRGFVSILNARLTNGRLYCLTERGREAVRTAFGVTYAPAPKRIHWKAYSAVACAKIRRLALAALGQLENKTGEGQTAAGLRKLLRPEYPVGLNPVIRAVHDLVELGLIADVGLTRQQPRKTYRLTPRGRRVLKQLQS